jgi:hypothetical protein
MAHVVRRSALRSIALLFVLAAIACHSENHGASGESRAAAAPAAATVDEALVKTHLDRAALKRAVQGAWVFERGEPFGNALLAAQIEGERATLWDGRRTIDAKLDVGHPCRVLFMVPDDQPDKALGLADAFRGSEGRRAIVGDQPRSWVDFAEAFYIMIDGVAQLSNGSVVGERVGRSAIVCTSDGIWALDDAGHCTRNQAHAWVFGHPVAIDTRATQCGFRSENSVESFYVREDGFNNQPYVSVNGRRIGNVLSAEELQRRGLGRHPDFATARATVDADARANDPLLIGLAAGGKVGETSTVAGLVATYGANAEKLERKMVRLGGVVAASDEQDFFDDNGVAIPGSQITIADPAHRDTPTVSCSLRGRVPDVGARVRVRGVVSSVHVPWTKRFAPALEECWLTSSAPSGHR